MIVSIHSNILHIRERLIPSFLLDFQIPDLDATDSKRRNLKFHCDGFLQVFFTAVVSNSRHQKL